VAALFELAHGSAPKHTGQNKFNPIAMMFSAATAVGTAQVTDAIIKRL